MKTCSLSALLLQIWRWPVVNILWQSILVVGSLPFLVPSDSWAQTLVCPADRGSGQIHWYSPVSNNLADHAPEQCGTCAREPNAQDPGCSVYRMLMSDECRDGLCNNDQGEFRVNWQDGYALQRSLRYKNPFNHILDARNNCWFLVWALEPVIGIEHWGARDSTNFWRAGYLAATEAIDPPIAQRDLAMLIQPADTRSQHQLHIHIGRLQPGYRESLDRLPQVPGDTHEIRLGASRLFVRYLPDLQEKQPLEGYRVFDEVSAMIPGGEASMPLFGVLVARATDGTGSWLVAREGLTRWELVLSEATACQFRKVN